MTNTEIVEAPLTPAGSLTRQTEVANLFKETVKDRGLAVSMRGNEHLRVEAWQLLGALNGISAVVTSTERLDDGWKAMCEARRLADGQVVGAGFAICTHAERMWSKADDYAVLSMAQTRATSKALKSCLGHLAEIAGFKTTPAEEMPLDGPTDLPAQAPRQLEGGQAKPTGRVISDKQVGLIRARTASKRLGDIWLAETIHKVLGLTIALPDFGGEWQKAKEWADGQLSAFPADHMDGILEEIGNAQPRPSRTPAATRDAQARRDGTNQHWGA